MRPSAIASIAFAAAALAGPVAKRDMVTDWTYVTVTKFVTPGVDPTPAPTEDAGSANSPGSFFEMPWINRHSQPAAEPTPSPSPSSSPSSSPSPSPEPEPSSEPAPESEPEPEPTSAAPEPTSVAPASTTATPEPEPAATETPSESDGDDYISQCLNHHNAHRSNHSAADLVWDEGLAATAMKIAQSCVYDHDTEMDGGGYGQNIAAGVPAERVSAVITDVFYNPEEPLFSANYGLDNPDMSNFHGWGHFTQIVWQDTTAVGCATYDCGPGGLEGVGSSVGPQFTVCNYKSPGNFGGEYANNVARPNGDATIHGKE
ncbi:CAP domain-containing protein [Lineolata rhizophorae]|uniref:CAP domain-containing protein n=1 Tax=Lineolata rhizophorae TaxID=578093 RepID=A0A6A6NST8_9PEZI|nr:CAP domain-containing protein [Lineolata rhizophorae]